MKRTFLIELWKKINDFNFYEILSAQNHDHERSPGKAKPAEIKNNIKRQAVNSDSTPQSIVNQCLGQHTNKAIKPYPKIKNLGEI